jgi:predicted patatin/cPLA2 family phospholipase
MTGLCGSAAVPFVFPPVPFEDKLLMDGGVVWNLDIASAIRKCRLLVDSDSKIVLDVIDLDSSLSLGPRAWKSEGNSIQNYLRLRKWRDYYQRIDDELEVRRAFPEVQYRYVISPKHSLDHIYQELSLDPHLLERLINMGMEDALEAIEKGHNHQPEAGK